MRLSFGLPVGGKLAGPESVVKVAQEAEKSGFDTLWVHDRLLYPVNPQTPYMGTPDGSLPEQPYKVSLDPLETLTWAAAHTSKIGIGTSILVFHFTTPLCWPVA